MLKNPPVNAEDTGDVGLIPQLRRSPGEGNDNPLQYSCLGNTMDRGAWWAIVHGRRELDMTEWLPFHLIFLHVYIYTHTYKLYIYIYIHTYIRIHQAIHYSVCKGITGLL